MAAQRGAAVPAVWRSCCRDRAALPPTLPQIQKCPRKCKFGPKHPHFINSHVDQLQILMGERKESSVLTGEFISACPNMRGWHSTQGLTVLFCLILMIIHNVFYVASLCIHLILLYYYYYLYMYVHLYVILYCYGLLSVHIVLTFSFVIIHNICNTVILWQHCLV